MRLALPAAPLQRTIADAVCGRGDLTYVHELPYSTPDPLLILLSLPVFCLHFHPCRDSVFVRLEGSSGAEH